MIAVYFRVIHKQTFSAVSVQFMMFWLDSGGNLILVSGLSAKVLIICSDTEAHVVGSSISVITSLTAPPSGFPSSFVVNHLVIFASASADQSDILLDTLVLESKFTKNPRNSNKAKCYNRCK